MRVNIYLAGGFGFNRPVIRYGLAKMRLRVILALTIMQALALGHVRARERLDICGVWSNLSA